MVRAAIKEASALRRKDFVPDDRRTSQRDRLADWIDETIVEGEWDWQETTISDIAAETDYSREHVARVLDIYFDPADGGRSDVVAELAMAAVDTDASGDDYQTGFRDGFEAGLLFALEHDDLIQPDK